MLTNCGIQVKNMVFLGPKIDTMYPNMKLPNTAPGPTTDPIQDISSIVRLPVGNGVAFD